MSLLLISDGSYTPKISDPLAYGYNTGSKSIDVYSLGTLLDSKSISDGGQGEYAYSQFKQMPIFQKLLRSFTSRAKSPADLIKYAPRFAKAGQPVSVLTPFSAPDSTAAVFGDVELKT